MNQMNKDSNSINITGLTDEEVRQLSLIHI